MGIARVSITIPKELKAKMDAVEGVNWSEVAREAIVSELARLQKKRPNRSKTRFVRLLTTFGRINGRIAAVKARTPHLLADQLAQARDLEILTARRFAVGCATATEVTPEG